MPLIKSGSKEALHENMRTLHSEIGKSPHVKSRAQAVAIALDVARRNRAAGGANAAPPWYVKSEAKGMHIGAIKSPVGGRTDHLPLNVPAGSYVLPSSHVAHLGQDNTAAGHATLDHMFSSGPFGAALPKMGHGKGLPSAGKAPTFKAHGGAAESPGNDSVPIMAAGGEYVIHPDIVRAIGEGNLDHGHQVLDEWVKRTRKKHIKVLSKLPGPAQ